MTTPSQLTPTQPTTKPSFFNRILDDFRSGKRYLLALSKAKELGAKKQAAERQLLTLFGELGAKAVEHGIGKDVAGFQEAQALGGKLIDAENTLMEKSVARKRTEDALAAETQRHSTIIASLDAEHRPLALTASTAGQQLGSVRQEITTLESQIKKTEAEIAAPPQPGQPAAISTQELQQRLATFQQSRAAAQVKIGPLEEKAAQAKIAADSKAGKVAAAKLAWSHAKLTCDGELASAKSDEAEATKSVSSVKSSLNVALQSLGRAVFEAGVKSPELASATSQAQSLLADIAVTAARIADQQKEAASSKGGAKRAAICVGGLATVLVLGVVLVVVIGGGKNKRHGDHWSSGGNSSFGGRHGIGGGDGDVQGAGASGNVSEAFDYRLEWIVGQYVKAGGQDSTIRDKGRLFYDYYQRNYEEQKAQAKSAGMGYCTAFGSSSFKQHTTANKRTILEACDKYIGLFGEGMRSTIGSIKMYSEMENRAGKDSIMAMCQNYIKVAGMYDGVVAGMLDTDIDFASISD